MLKPHHCNQPKPEPVFARMCRWKSGHPTMGDMGPVMPHQTSSPALTPGPTGWKPTPLSAFISPAVSPCCSTPLSPPAIASHDTTPTLSWQTPAAAGNPRGFLSPRAKRPPARCTPWTPACDGQQHLLHPALLRHTLPSQPDPIIKAPSPILGHLCGCFKALIAGST